MHETACCCVCGAAVDADEIEAHERQCAADAYAFDCHVEELFRIAHAGGVNAAQFFESIAAEPAESIAARAAA